MLRLVSDVGRHADFRQVNIAGEMQVQELIHGIGCDYGRLDATFNNAGIFGRTHPLATYPKADWDRGIEVNPPITYEILRSALHDERPKRLVSTQLPCASAHSTNVSMTRSS